MQQIQTILTKIEQTKNVQILYACETGSRAWGFPSPDSDYDVRFIYRHERDWYLSLSQHKNTIEYMVDETWDVTGWDLRKSLLLLKKSNAALIERFQSPMVYSEAGNFKDEFKHLIKTYYSPTAVFFHHYSQAKNFWETLKDASDVKLKSYFYLIRSLLSCNWIIQKKSVLPMHIEGLMVLIDDDKRKRLRALIQLKAGVGEKYLHPKDEGLNKWIMDLWALIEASKENLGVNRTDMKQLNDFFLQTIQ